MKLKQEGSLNVGKEKQGPVFLDTSIHIARVVHGPKTKARIRARLAQHERTVTGLVARQEYKRRLLEEAEYILRLLHRYNSFDEVNQHLIRLYGPWPGRERKRRICLQMLSQVHDESDKERTERLRLYLRSLLVVGLKRFDQSVDTLCKESDCGCAKIDVVEKKQFHRYELGPTHCSQLKPGACGIVAFLTKHKDVRAKLLKRLKGIPELEKSVELRNAENFLEGFVKKPSHATQEDPCLCVGDLLIAIESIGVPNFYTLNSTESQHLCRDLDQTLLVCPIDPSKEEVICDSKAQDWPPFGRTVSPAAKKKKAGDE